MNSKKPLSQSQKMTIILGTFVVVIIGFLYSPEAFSMGADADKGMVKALGPLEATLKGPWTKGAMLAGSAVGLIMSVMKQSVIPLAVGLGIGLLAMFQQTWVSTAFTSLI